MSTRRAVFPLALIAATLSLSAQTPSQQPPDPQRPIFRTEANFIRVDVFPTRGGAPVKNLTAVDFEVLEDGVPQKVETFEYVEVRGNLAQPERNEPNTLAESRRMMTDPRARVFVIFLDLPHVTVGGAWHVRAPLVRLVDRILGPDDLVGIMTPGMAASDITFARKTQVMTDGLFSRFPWGERFTLERDEREDLYDACYPWPETQEVVDEMTARRRERSSLDALYELVGWLRDQREERKAILTVSEGWALYRQNADLTRPRVIDRASGATEPIPGPEPIGVGPDGRLRIAPDRTTDGTKTTCDRDRVHLSMINNDTYFREIIGAANTANASFYTVDPRGLAVFDAPIGPDAPPPVHVDMANLRGRLETLRTLAEGTDGLAALNSNDIEKGLRRMADDLTSYYLLGYYSTNTKLDGRFRQIKVRVKQPGIDVRARRGYKAATEAEMAAARKAAPPPVPAHVSAAQTALGGLARLRPSSRLATRAVAVQGDKTMLWVAGELRKPGAAAATAEITVTTGDVTASATAPIAAGDRAFLVPVPLTVKAVKPIDVRVRISEGAGQIPFTDMLQITPADGLPQPVLYRRGPATGNRLQPAGEPVFSRTERLRIELPAAADRTLGSGRLLDRNGSPIELPVTLGERVDDGGRRWLTADITLAPLGAGDYVMELTGAINGTEQKALTAIRVTR